MIRVLPNSIETQVDTVTAFANGEFHLNSTLGRVRLSRELSVSAINRDYADYFVKAAVVGNERIEIGQSSTLFGFFGISTSFQIANISDRGCTVRRFGTDESVRWYQYVKGASCTDLSVAENGDIWLVSSTDIVTLNADGTLKLRHSRPSVSVAGINGVVAARGANIGSAFVRYEGPVWQTAAVALVDVAGEEQWRIPVDVPAPELRALADGGVEIVGSKVRTFNASGQQVSERQDDVISGTIITKILDAETGERWVLTRASECALTKLSNSGSTLWRAVLPCTVTEDRVRNPNTGDSQRAAVLTSQHAVAVVGKNAIAILNSTGALLLTQSVSDAGIGSAALNPNGTQLLYVANTEDLQFGSNYKLRQITIATKRDQSVNLPARSGDYSTLIAQEAAPDGTTYAFIRNQTGTPATLMAIELTGQVRWQKAVNFDGYYDSLIGASNSMLCITRSVRAEPGESSLLCWNSFNGQLLFELKKPYGYFPNDNLRLDSSTVPSMRVYGDRVLIARARASGSATIVGVELWQNYEGISDTGTQLFAFDLPGGMTEHLWGERGLIATNAPPRSYSVQDALSYFAAHGTYRGFNDSDTLLSLWDENGLVISTYIYPYAQSELSGATTVSSGAIFGRREGIRMASSDPRAIGMALVPGTLFYEFFDLNGILKWRRPASLYDTGFLEPELAEGIYPIIPANIQVALKEDRREAQPMLYALRSYDVGDFGFALRRSVLQKINLSTGALAWRRSVNVDPAIHRNNALQTTLADSIDLPLQKVNGNWQVLVYGISVAGKSLVEHFDAETGASLDLQATGDLYPESAAITSGSTRYVVRQDPPLPRTARPLGAPSQVGAWYNPSTPGQGLFVERIGNTQFMAWFHNDWDLPDTSVSDFLSPARQRWLSLQGEVTPGATQAELKIYQTSGGSFTQGSSGAPIEIGSATLTFLNCDSATLNYELYAQRCAGVACAADQQVGMLHGVIPLRALLPASGCATPTSLPTPISSKTGLFHDPNVSGQGLITVVNANTLFAGWFTRDPANAADDPQKQAWFTLQASIPVSSNPNGVIQAKIYRTLGGRRDSTLPVISQDVGDATLSFASCDRVTMQYRFAATESAKPFQNLAGQLNLVRIGACR